MSRSAVGQPVDIVPELVNSDENKHLLHFDRCGADAAGTYGVMQSAPAVPLRRLEHLTFKGNLKATRYGWLRLTPAYSVHLVAELLETKWTEGDRVLDPFCGTGKTALVCAERGIPCDTTDINPFLLWLARSKAATYSPATVRTYQDAAAAVRKAMLHTKGQRPWVPELHQIEKWWNGNTLAALARGMDVIRSKNGHAADLLRIAFCRTMI